MKKKRKEPRTEKEVSKDNPIQATDQQKMAVESNITSDQIPSKAPKAAPDYSGFTGMQDERSSASMIMSIVDAFPKKYSKDDAGMVTLSSLRELAPQDPIEGMLCSQIVALDAQGLRHLARAENEENWLCHTEAAVNMAIKLLRLKNETLDLLMRHRRKAEQRVLVQHINVNDQSKAVIGDIVAGGGGNV